MLHGGVDYIVAVNRREFPFIWKGRDSYLPALVSGQCPYPCHPSCVYTCSGQEGMLAGRAPLFLQAPHSFRLFSLRERAYSRAILNSRNSLVCRLPLPSQCSYPCHPSC